MDSLRPAPAAAELERPPPTASRPRNRGSNRFNRVDAGVGPSRVQRGRPADRGRLARRERAVVSVFSRDLSSGEQASPEPRALRGRTPGPPRGTAAIAERSARLRRRAGPEVCRPTSSSSSRSSGAASRAAGEVAVELAAVAPADVVEPEASLRPGTAAGPDVETTAQPVKRGDRCVGRQVAGPADVACANSSTPPAGPVATWR